MVTAQRNLPIPRFLRYPRPALVAISVLVGVLSLAIAFGTLIPPPNTAHAGSNEPWLYLECLEDVVEEGDDFRLQVRKKYKSHSPHKTMRVFWYTEAITADETDYEYMYAVRQASNRYQSEVLARWVATFHTLEDIYPEIDETYVVRFNNSVDYGSRRQVLPLPWRTTTASASMISRSALFLEEINLDADGHKGPQDRLHHRRCHSDRRQVQPPRDHQESRHW